MQSMSKTGGLWLNVSVPPGASTVSEIPLFSAPHYFHFANTRFVRLIHLIVEPCFKTESALFCCFKGGGYAVLEAEWKPDLLPEEEQHIKAAKGVRGCTICQKSI